MVCISLYSIKNQTISNKQIKHMNKTLITIFHFRFISKVEKVDRNFDL